MISSRVIARLNFFLYGLSPSSIVSITLSPGRTFFNVTVDAFLDEDLDQRTEVPLLFQLRLPYLQLPLEEVERLVGIVTKDFVDGKELGLSSTITRGDR